MPRVLEPPLMLSPEEVSSYASVDRTALIAFMLQQVRSDGVDLEKFSTAIDVGCGCGDLSISLAKKFPNLNIIGVDGSDEMLRIAKERKDSSELLNISFEKSVVGEDSFDAKFDIVVNSFALHHFENPIQALNNLKNLALSSGYIIIFDMLREDDHLKANSVVDTITNSYFNFSGAAAPQPFKNSFFDSLQACLSLEELNDAVAAVFGPQAIKVFNIFSTPNQDDGLNIAMVCIQV